MSTNSNSKCKILLCLALPFSVAAGYASDSNRPLNTVSFIDAPAPIAAPVSARQTADIAINKEIFYMFMADTSINYNMSATVNNGVVTIVGTSTGKIEKQRVVNEIWELVGVNQVKNELGVNTPSTLPEKSVAVR